MSTGESELPDKIQARAWYDGCGDDPPNDGNNIREDDEEVFLEGTLREVLDALSNGMGVPLDGDESSDTAFDETGGSPSYSARDCYTPADDVHYIGFEWWVPKSVGNEIQADSVEFDLGFYTEQCRNNDGSGMGDPVESGEFEARDANGELITTFDAVESDETVESYYSFGSPDAGSANTGLERSDTAVAFVYRNTNTDELSLVLIFDEANDGTGGSTSVSITGSGFGTDGWVVSDDPSEGLSYSSGGPASGDWTFGTSMTDGGALDIDETSFDLAVNPDFTGFTDFSEWLLVDGGGNDTTLSTAEDPDAITFGTS